VIISAADERRLAVVLAALQAQDLARATALAREALAAGLEHPLLLNLRAYWHEAEGRDLEAFGDLQRAYELAPNDVSVLNALGLAHGRAGRMLEAARVFDSITTLQPDFVPAYFNKGWASEELGNLDLARECFSHAAELNPGSADAWARLAALAVRLGDWDSAGLDAERSLKLDARNAIARQALANVALAKGDAPAAERSLRAMLADDLLGPLDRANAEGLLGDVLDAMDRTKEAFDAYASSNTLLRNTHAPRFSDPGIETMPQYLEWLSSWFERLDPSQWLSSPPPGPGDGPVLRSHIFLLGFPRSGTTLLEEIFRANPSVTATQERDGLVDGVRELMGRPGDLDRLASLQGAGFARYRRLYWQRLGEQGVEPGSGILLDKQPYNSIKLPLISKLFPEAKIIFSIRDPRDVVFSCFRRRFRMNPSNFELLTLESAARFYDAVMRLADLYSRKLTLRLHKQRHEDLVTDMEGQVRAICDFVDVPWDDGMQAFAQRRRGRAIATPSATQIERGLSREGIGQWRRYKEQMAPVLPLLQPWVERFGYRPD
jgi:tetratricopeptide (TPR) repeat protein